MAAAEGLDPVILAVDPGINHCGCALFSELCPGSSGGFLLRAWLVHTPGSSAAPALERCAAMARAVYRSLAVDEWQAVGIFVAEWPKIYPPRRGQRRLDPNVALVPLAGVQAAIAAHLLPSTLLQQYLPREWKGTLDGDAFVRVIARHMETAEFQQIAEVPASLRHNVYDAIGLGLKYLGRLEKRRIISRGTK